MAYIFKNTILKVNNVNLTLGGNHILRDINLEIKDVVRPDVKQGQIVSLLGASGSGKSQLFKILSGLNTPDSGEVLIGEDLKPVKAGNVGFVQQNYPLWEHRTVYSNIHRAANGLPKSEKKDKIEYYLNHFGLWEKQNLYPNQLSGGQKQRVAIAQALIHSGNFILLDEPFSGLDTIMIDKVSEMIINIANLDELNTIIIVSHDLISTCAISDTVYLLGKERDLNNNLIKGSTIIDKYDLMNMGLAWNKNIRDLSEFHNLTKTIRDRFNQIN